MTIYVVEMNEWGCGLYNGAGNLLTFVSFCDKNTGVWVICGAGYSLENTVDLLLIFIFSFQRFGLPFPKDKYRLYTFTYYK